MTDTQIKNAKPQSKDYPIYDGNVLLLLIKSTGTKYGNLAITPFNSKKYLYHAYIEYVRNSVLNNPIFTKWLWHIIRLGYK